MTLLQRDPPRAPAHHPAIDVLAEYAAGQMRAGFDVVVATHLRGCAQCRRQVAHLEALGGGLLESIPPARLDDGALAATLDRLDQPLTTADGPAATVDTLGALLAGARRRWIAPGVWVAPVKTPHHRDDRVFLLRVGAGMATAPHTHNGVEMTQVLSGALADSGVTYRAGDMVEMDEDHMHYPKVVGDEPCICLIATCGRLKPTTLIGKVVFTLAGV